MNSGHLAISSSHLNVMLKATMAASNGIVRDFGELENLQVSSKSTGGFVTKSDQRAEEVIYNHLARARPSYGFLFEEAGIIPGEDPDYCWIVDALDGTLNFMHGYPHFAISIALEYRNEVVSALVYDPIKDELFYAEKGRGCFYNDRRIRIASRTSLDCALIGIRFPNTNEHNLINWFMNANKQVASIRKSGSSVLDLCYVASGRLDGYIGSGLSPWDIAAGILFIKEGGGFILDFEMKSANHKNKQIVAGNNYMSKSLLNMQNKNIDNMTS